MYTFFTTVHARSPEVVAGVTLPLRGAATTTLIVPPTALAFPFGVSFEQAIAALEQLARMFVEPDGSFVWVSSSDDSGGTRNPWQIDGNLFDRNGMLLLIDLKGSCPPKSLDMLLGCVGWPETDVMFELTREAVFLNEFEFRQYAGRSVAV